MLVINVTYCCNDGMRDAYLATVKAEIKAQYTYDTIIEKYLTD